jgi:mevalonyl-CoA ligase
MIRKIGSLLGILRFGLMAGSAMPEELLLRVINKFPIRDIYTNWGMTELSSIATMTSATDAISKKQRTAGKLLPNLTAKIVSPNTGTVLRWGARGEIVVSGFSVMHSYFEDVERTRASIKHHIEDGEIIRLEAIPGGELRGWMHTGDEGYLDEDGYLVVTGRIKDLIIRGGENIAPLEIEARLFAHPAIKQACVFGIPNERYGEVVAAFLELEDRSARPEDEAIREWARGTLSRFKVPVRVWWLGDVERGCPVEWPKTANGKLRKKDIREIGASKRAAPLCYPSLLIMGLTSLTSKLQGWQKKEPRKLSHVLERCCDMTVFAMATIRYLLSSVTARYRVID